MIRRLRKEPELLFKYNEIIREQENRGFIETVDENIVPNQRVHYIPHHGVKKDSVTTPIRIVYDCSCRQSADKPSLNDCLMSTSPDLNDLTGILIRFRLNKYAVTTDIEKTFLHVSLDENDRDVTRFFWLSNPNDPDSSLITFRFKAVLFGAKCSPFILSATILKHLEINCDSWVSEHIRKDIYVDNIVSSFPQEEDVIKFFRDTRSLMSAANFHLRSWNSNSNTVRELAKSENVLEKDETSKILGIRWEAENDILAFPLRPIPTMDIVTKREILQHTSRLYDPLGLLTPVTIRAKIILQELWQLKCDWDWTLPSDLHQKWNDTARDMNIASASRFDRYLFKPEADYISDKADDITMQVFSDASTKSYGAAVYICKGMQSALVMAKSRVASLKGISLPRLELMAAVIGARLAKHVQQEVGTPKIVMWSDSQIVLHWLQTPKQLKRFVTNRVSEINKLTDNRKWRYCPTNYNPADLLTRGISAKQFINNKLWFNGPEWICDTEKWPIWDPQTTITMTTGTDDLMELEPATSRETASIDSIVGIHSILDATRYGTLRKLLRVTGFVLRFVHKCRKKSSSKRIELDHLTVQELLEAEQYWIRNCQKHSYGAEIDSIKSGTRLPLVKQLRLFMDDTGNLRCGGRIHNAPLTEATKFPYLLPQRHPFTRLLVLDAHQRLLHSGSSSTITYLRQRYWILVIRQCVRSVIRKCVVCRKVNGKPFLAPDPPPLQKFRVEDTHPFTVTGVDFSGALYVRGRNGEETKAYVCLFTCAASRAVHLELVPDLTTESFLQAFRRFCSRKSLPRLMVSDNATTCLSAASHLHKVFQSKDVQEILNGNGTEWRFIIKRAPWYGGWWERLVGLTKTTLKKILGRSHVTFDTLATIVTEVEAILNDRPLTYVISGEVDLEPLTPAHLLYGRRITEPPHSDVPIPTTDGIVSNQSSTDVQTSRRS